MRLADFIEGNIVEIVDEAEAFAMTLGLAGGRLDSAALRDHIPHMLHVIVADLRTSQTASESTAKSEGKFSPLSHAAITAAQTHAGVRADQGFDVMQLVSEYRVLRASILRLWAKRHAPNEYAIADITRFNEAIDQAVAESVDTFVAQIDRWRDVFLGILGHELRGPLSTILLASDTLGRMELDERAARSVARLVGAGKRMRSLLDELLDFNRVSFGIGLVINRAPVDLSQACASEIELIRTNWPDQQISFLSTGETQGAFDESRVREVVWNLITNAAKYGDEGRPIDVFLDGDGQGVKITVQNSGPDISAAQLGELFEPLRRATNEAESHGSLGLGLFVVKQVALAHGGDVEVRSGDGLTEFVVQLCDPSRVSAAF